MTPSARVLAAKILVVDDQEASLDLMEQILRGAGYKSVLFTSDPAEVYELHRLHHFDLILLDLQMLPMDGFMVMKGLKTLERDHELPVMVIAAEPDHEVRALDAGAGDFISKPVQVEEVLIRVSKMIELRLLELAKNP